MTVSPCPDQHMPTAPSPPTSTLPTGASWSRSRTQPAPALAEKARILCGAALDTSRLVRSDSGGGGLGPAPVLASGGGGAPAARSWGLGSLAERGAEVDDEGGAIGSCQVCWIARVMVSRRMRRSRWQVTTSGASEGKNAVWDEVCRSVEARGQSSWARDCQSSPRLSGLQRGDNSKEVFDMIQQPAPDGGQHQAGLSRTNLLDNKTRPEPSSPRAPAQLRPGGPRWSLRLLTSNSEPHPRVRNLANNDQPPQLTSK